MSKRSLCLLCSFILIGLVMKEWIGKSSLSLPISPFYQNQSILASGIIEKIQKSDTGFLLYLKQAKLVSNQPEISQTPKEYKRILIYMEEIHWDQTVTSMGSPVLLSGKVRLFSAAGNPGEFDSKRYYAIRGIPFALSEGEYVRVSEEKNHFRIAQFQVQQKLEQNLKAILGEKNGSIMAGIVLGQKSGIDEETKELYQESGISHILAVSGLHISFIGMGMYHLMRKLRLNNVFAVFLSGGLLLVYYQLIGFSPSGFRAVCMFFSWLGARLFGRTYDSYTALCVSALLILVPNPGYVYDGGFWLSFLAVFGISLSNSIFRGRQKWVSGLALQLILLPLMAKLFFQISLYSFFLNLLIIPLMGILLPLGFLTACFGGIPAIGVRVILWLIERVSSYSLSLPFATFITGEPAWWQMAVYYLFLAIGVWWIRERKIEVKTMVCFVGLVFLGTGILCYHQENRLVITILDVGQGDGICLQSPSGRNYLIDGGSSSKKKVGTKVLLPFLKASGIRRLDYVFVTHMDQDHVSGIVELLESDYVVKVLAFAATPSIEDEEQAHLIELAKQKKTKVVWLEEGSEIRDGILELKVLHPSLDFNSPDKNANSLVLHMSYKEFCGIFTGDLGEAEEKRLLKKGKLEDCDFLKVGHHGSEGSTSKDFLEQVSPEVALISCGFQNSYGHPHQRVLDFLEAIQARIFRTDLMGAVIIKSDGSKKYQVQTFKKASIQKEKNSID